jgi:hypothetical protein
LPFPPQFLIFHLSLSDTLICETVSMWNSCLKQKLFRKVHLLSSNTRLICPRIKNSHRDWVLLFAHWTANKSVYSLIK